MIRRTGSPWFEEESPYRTRNGILLNGKKPLYLEGINQGVNKCQQQILNHQIFKTLKFSLA
jgi:hypothetical protein